MIPGPLAGKPGGRAIFAAAVLAMLAVMAARQVTSALQETQTFDEGMHLAAGYSYLVTGDFRLNPEHPPLGKELAALPLLAVDPDLPLEHRAWKESILFDFGAIFLYRNRLPADQILLLGRLPTIALTMILGCVLAFWTRTHFGTAPALFATFLFSSDPNFIAHGRYVTTDVIAALVIFASCIAWRRFLQTRRWRDLVLAGIVLGLALAAKFSTIFLLPLFPALYWIRWWQDRKSSNSTHDRPGGLSHIEASGTGFQACPAQLPRPARGLRRLWRTAPLHFVISLAVACALACAVLALAYWPDTVRSLTGDGVLPLAEQVDRSRPAGRLFYPVAEALHLPGHAYLRGLYSLATHEEQGHQSYVLGRHSETGWWYYFPVVFGVKTPAAVLLLLAFSLGLIAWSRRLPAPAFRWVIVTLPPVVYFVLSMRSAINLGVRHILPVYPFLFVLISAVPFLLVKRRKLLAAVLGLAVGLQLFESVRIHPHYLAFFNSFVGGSKNGPKYLVDSNLDWGQDVKKLMAYMASRGLQSVCFAYFGAVDVNYYKIPHTHLPRTWQTEERQKLDCVAAISATILQDVYIDKGSYEWLRQLEPVDRVGYSIYIYDLRKKSEATPKNGD